VVTVDAQGRITFAANATPSIATTQLTGTLAVSSGGTGATSSTGTGSTVLSASPTFTGAPLAPTAAVTTDNTQIATTAFVRDIIPAGVILLWSGSVASIPTGWVLCNGANSTPDLRDRFVVGAGSSYAVNATGGANTVTLDATMIPSHTHSLSASGTTSGQSAGHTHTFSGTTSGQSVSHTHTATVTDPEHAHTYFRPVASNAANPPGSSGSQASSATTSTAATGITVSNGNASADHTHTYSGTTSAVSGDHTHTVTVTGTSGGTGGGLAHENRPPYFALAYIMKT
jgi:microcystin-dependent protein